MKTATRKTIFWTVEERKEFLRLFNVALKKDYKRDINQAKRVAMGQMPANRRRPPHGVDLGLENKAIAQYSAGLTNRGRGFNVKDKTMLLDFDSKPETKKVTDSCLVISWEGGDVVIKDDYGNVLQLRQEDGTVVVNRKKGEAI